MAKEWKVIRIPEEEYNLAKEIAREEESSLSSVIKKSLDHYIGCEKKGKIEAKVAEALEYTEELHRLLKAWRMP